MGNRIVISESQYSRLFLNEQPNKDKVNVFKTGYERAQQQWAAFGADNPKTGRDLIPDDAVKYYKDLYDKEMERINQKVGKKPVDWYSSAEATGLGMDSNHPSNFQHNWESQPKQWKDRLGVEVSKSDNTYFNIISFNNNIKNQKKLIPQHCKNQI